MSSFIFPSVSFVMDITGPSEHFNIWSEDCTHVEIEPIERQDTGWIYDSYLGIATPHIPSPRIVGCQFSAFGSINVQEGPNPEREAIEELKRQHHDEYLDLVARFTALRALSK